METQAAGKRAAVASPPSAHAGQGLIMTEPALDVITIGRSSVDLYGQQIGGRLEDMASFAKSVGGCPSNIAIGTARLGLKSAVITGVGDEHMGRFIREQMAREGVATDGIFTDPKRLTALVILGVRDSESFPLIFYRENCADMALDADAIDESFIAGCRALLITGTHLSAPAVRAASTRALEYAARHQVLRVLDIDYRPVLWGLTGHGLGEERFVASDEVTAHLQRILPECDLIVGTEEEIHIAGGSTDTMAAIRAERRSPFSSSKTWLTGSLKSGDGRLISQKRPTPPMNQRTLRQAGRRFFIFAKKELGLMRIAGFRAAQLPQTVAGGRTTI